MTAFRSLRILLAGALFALTMIAAGPGKIEAEAYSLMTGVATEACSDTGGGLDVGWIDKGDWMVYPITVPATGQYKISYRVATPNNGVALSADMNAASIPLGSVAIPNTGGWQTWTTVTQTVTLNAGSYTFGINAGTGGFNLNWFSIDSADASNVGPAGYTWCAGENGSYTFNQTVDVAYGANGAFAYKSGVTGTITFNNATFGDPISGVAKAGYYKEAAITGPAGYTWCAGENGSYTFSQSVDLAYGANGTFAYKTGVAAGSITFNNATFGDPIPGVAKAGFYKISAYVGPAGYSWCANENASASFNQTVDVAYGANGAFAYKSGVSGTITFNNATFGDPAFGVAKAGYYKASGGSTSLIPLAAGSQMTIQCQNNTGGKYADSQIYLVMTARNSAGNASWVDKNGNLIACAGGQVASSYSYRLSDITGYQLPARVDAARLYVSMGAPMNMTIDPNHPTDLFSTFPDVENAYDANNGTYYDFVEFTLVNNQIWCNTTQVEQFCLPLVMELFQTSGSSYTTSGKVGITDSRANLFSAWSADVPSEFKALANTYRIVAPVHGGFRAAQANGGYFTNYISSVWSQYTGSDLTIPIPQGTFTGRVQADGRLRFTRSGDAASYYVGRPSSEEVFAGSGPMTAGNDIEQQLGAQVCAAFHRHVLENPAFINSSTQYYHAAPADYYSKFWHDHSINGKAYGFCYDDRNGQDSILSCASPRGIVLSVGF